MYENVLCPRRVLIYFLFIFIIISQGFQSINNKFLLVCICTNTIFINLISFVATIVTP